MITKFKCKICKQEKSYDFPVFNSIEKCRECDMDMEKLGFFCPVCGLKLHKKHEGFVCQNWKCCMAFKLGKGWCYLDREEKDKRWMVKYSFDIATFENQKRWLKVKSDAIVRDNFKCKVCSKSYDLEVHHILPRSEHPELSLDLENLMTLCIECHALIHKDDKYKFNRK